MSRTPIERMLDEIEWTALERPIEFNVDLGLPMVTHEGILRIEAFEFRCFQLDNGQRVFNADDVERFFGGARGGEAPLGSADTEENAEPNQAPSAALRARVGEERGDG